jgi:hypothetical protein
MFQVTARHDFETVGPIIRCKWPSTHRVLFSFQPNCPDLMIHENSTFGVVAIRGDKWFVVNANHVGASRSCDNILFSFTYRTSSGSVVHQGLQWSTDQAL